MPKHTDAEKAKNVRALISRSIDTFPPIERVERAKQRKKLNLKFNPRARPITKSAPAAPAPKTPIIVPGRKPDKIPDIPTGIGNIERLAKDRAEKLKKASE